MQSKFGSKFESSHFDLENCQVILNSLSSRPSKGKFDLWSQPVGLDLLGKVHVSRSRASKAKMEAAVFAEKNRFP